MQNLPEVMRPTTANGNAKALAQVNGTLVRPMTAYTSCNEIRQPEGRTVSSTAEVLKVTKTDPKIGQQSKPDAAALAPLKKGATSGMTLDEDEKLKQVYDLLRDDILVIWKDLRKCFKVHNHYCP